MAIFPEDVPVPASVFDLLATTIFVASSKRPQLQIRSWLTALIRLSLVIGSLADGVFMHDIVRDYSMSRCADLRTQHREFLAALLDAAPPSGWPALFSVGRHKRGSPERYVGSHVRWHMQHAVDPTQVDDELAERNKDRRPAKHRPSVRPRQQTDERRADGATVGIALVPPPSA